MIHKGHIAVWLGLEKKKKNQGKDRCKQIFFPVIFVEVIL